MFGRRHKHSYTFLLPFLLLDDDDYLFHLLYLIVSYNQWGYIKVCFYKTNRKRIKLIIERDKKETFQKEKKKKKK